jgi:hypothetical protein
VRNIFFDLTLSICDSYAFYAAAGYPLFMRNMLAQSPQVSQITLWHGGDIKA